MIFFSFSVTCLVAINQKILNGSSNAYYLHISPRREYINHENCLLFFPWLSYVLKKALEFDLWYGFKHIYPPHRIFFATQKTKTNQTHNVKDLMVVEFFSNNVYKIQPTFLSTFTILKKYDICTIMKYPKFRQHFWASALFCFHSFVFSRKLSLCFSNPPLWWRKFKTLIFFIKLKFKWQYQFHLFLKTFVQFSNYLNHNFLHLSEKKVIAFVSITWKFH